MDLAADFSHRRDAGSASVDAGTLALLSECASIAGAAGGKIWWVGGGVRDLFLGGRSALAGATRSADLDLAFVGSFERFLEQATARFETRRIVASPFLTATIELRSGRRLDVVRARRESYPVPGGLPSVEPATLREDLLRRDFTVNSMAIELGDGVLPLGGCLDPSGGLSDLSRRWLRTHHAGSFVDDPTRIFRAVDFEGRFGLALTPEAESSARAALVAGALGRLSGARLVAVLRRTFAHSATLEFALKRLGALGALAAIHPALRTDGVRWGRLASAISWLDGIDREKGAADLDPAAARFELGLLSTLAECSESARREIAARLSMEGDEAMRLVDAPARISAVRIDSGDSASDIHERLSPLTVGELAFLAGRSAEHAGWATRELTSMRYFRLGIDGTVLIEHGMAPGPGLGRALARTRAARLDGRIGADEELEFALETNRPTGTEE